jgi:hypothetical protein
MILVGQGNKGIVRISANGGKPETIVSVKESELAHGPQMLPGGGDVLFTLAPGNSTDQWDKAQIVVQSLKSGERKVLVNGGSDARYVATGHLIYALSGTLLALPFDVKRLAVSGGPVSVVEGIQRAAGQPRARLSSAFPRTDRWFISRARRRAMRLRLNSRWWIGTAFRNRSIFPKDPTGIRGFHPMESNSLLPATMGRIRLSGFTISMARLPCGG